MRYLVLLSYIFLCTHVIVAQNETNIKKFNITKSDRIQRPIMLTTNDSEKKSFDPKSILTANFYLPSSKDFTDILETTNNVLELDPLESEFAIQSFSFNIIANKFTKSNLIVKSSDMFELYVDNVKVGEKYTQGESEKKLPETKNNITLYPFEQKNIVIKLLRNNDLKVKELLEVTLKTDSTCNIQTNNRKDRRTKIEDNLVGERLTQSSISPNGEWVINKTVTVNEKGERTNSSYLYNLSGKEIKSTKLEDGYSWMPTSNLLFAKKTNKNNSYNLVIKNPNTFEEKILAENLPSNTSSRILPNEEYIILSEKRKLDKRKGDIKALLSPEDRQNDYLDRTILFLYNIPTKSNEQIFFSDQSVYIDDVSKNSDLLLLSTYKEEITQRPFRSKSSFLYNLSTRKLDTLFIDEKFVGGGKLSPDNKQIVFTGSAESFDGIGNNLPKDIIPNSYNNLAYLYDIKSKNINPITKNFTPSIKNVSWINNGNLLLNTVDEVYENLYSYDINKKQFTKLNLNGDVITQYSLDASGKLFSYISRGIKTPTEAYIYNFENKTNKLLSAPMKDIMGNMTLGKVEDWKYINKDSVLIDGFFHLPPDFDASKKYPLLVYYYGGTTPTSKTFEHPYSMHYFASLGYVVYTIIPSGAIGYGQEFAAKHVNAWGIQTADDIIDATKYFITNHPFILEDKIGCLGASYGGFMTMYLLTQTDLFKAAIAHAGISSIASYWGEGYWGYSYSSGASANSYPWNNPDLYIKQSPLFNADKVSAPLLLTHGTVDTNVPIGESIQMFTALKILGKPVEFLQVNNENHGIATFRKKVDWSHSMGAWFDRWLKNEPNWWFDTYPETKTNDIK